MRRSGGIWLFGTVAALMAATPPAGAAVTEYPLPEGFEQPLATAVDDHGIVWFTMDGGWGFGRFDPVSAQAVKLPFGPKPTADDALYSIAIGPDGDVWTASQTQLHQYDQASGEIRAYNFPARTQLAGGVLPLENGVTWAALVTADGVVRVDTEAGQIRPAGAPSANFGPLEFARSPDGETYLSATYGNTYARLDVNAREMTAAPAGLVAAPTGIVHDGTHLWLGEHGASSLVRIDPATNVATRFPSAPSPYYPISGPSGVAISEDGAIWYAIHFADRIARFDPVNLTLVEYEVPSAPGTNLQKIAIDDEGRVWFGEWSKNRLGFATYEGEEPMFTLPSELELPNVGEARVQLNASGTFTANTGVDGLTATVENGTLTVRSDGAAAGTHHVLVSQVDGKTYVGRYMQVHVQAAAETPTAPIALALGTVTLVALLRPIGRRPR